MVSLYYRNNDTSQKNYEALGANIDFESNAITSCLKTTFDDATDNTDDATGNPDDMLRMNENAINFLSPVAEKLPQEISNNSPSKLKMHTQNTILASRKNMVDNIQYVIDHGNIANNERVGQIWDELEKNHSRNESESPKRDICNTCQEEFEFSSVW